MTKYVIQGTSGKGFNAGSKAKIDVCQILMQEGYVPFNISITQDRFNPAVRYFLLLCQYVKLFSVLKKSDTVLIQWPMQFASIGVFYWILRHRCDHLFILLHDLEKLRDEDYRAEWTMKFIRICKRVIVHSQPMKDYLEGLGIEADIRILTAFDYLTDDQVPDKRRKSKEVVFAGNLKKSDFLQKVSESHLGFNLNCYGKKIDNLPSGLTYRCAFRPEGVSVLEGSWGLVWDGKSVDSCTGRMGEYQRYNAPHKLSLYIVSHLPVIVWCEAAMAPYVRDRGLGICVASLREVAGRIDAMTQEEYDQILTHVKKEAQLLRAGAHIKACLE